MLPSGILVRSSFEDLASSLPDRLVRNGPPGLKIEVLTKDPGPVEHSLIKLVQWPDPWCLIEIDGPEEITTLVLESLVRYKPVSEALFCHFKPEAGEYSYSLFRKGALLESFECRGPSMEMVNFTSEIRKVELKNLLKASDFMISSMHQFGFSADSGPGDASRRTTILVDFPTKKTFWQTLLGAVSPK